MTTFSSQVFRHGSLGSPTQQNYKAGPQFFSRSHTARAGGPFLARRQHGEPNILCSHVLLRQTRGNKEIKALRDYTIPRFSTCSRYTSKLYKIPVRLLGPVANCNERHELRTDDPPRVQTSTEILEGRSGHGTIDGFDRLHCEDIARLRETFFPVRKENHDYVKAWKEELSWATPQHWEDPEWIQSQIDRRCADNIRMLVVDSVQNAKAGHPGLPMGMAEVGYALYRKVMRCNPKNPSWFNRDRFVLSAGHGCLLPGFDSIQIDDLKSICKLGSRTPGHPENLTTDGVEITTDDEFPEIEKDEMKWRMKFSKHAEQHIPDHLLPKVAIVGRPNVGKSALFNRIVGADAAIVDDEPGVTRDRLYRRASWGLHEFMLVDTGGVLTIPASDGTGSDGIPSTGGGGHNPVVSAIEDGSTAGLPSMIEKQVAVALVDAVAIVFVVDGQAGLLSADIDIADWLRKKHSDKKIILAVNKCESPTKGLLQVAEFWSLSFHPMAVSAISGRGTGDLLDAICSGLKSSQVPEELTEEEARTPAIAIIGRPNAGKSSILNALVGEERAIVSPISGTTRDAIDTEISTPDGQVYILIDTAGIRRRAAIASGKSKAESLSVNRAFRAIRRSDVVALVIDAMDCVTEQDYRLGERIEEEGKGCVIVVNKWDTIPEKDGKTVLYYEQDVREKLRVLDWAPIVYTSAISGQKVDRILQAAMEIERERTRRLNTSVLNQVVQEAGYLKQPPKIKGGKKGRIYYCTQAAIRPPTFVFFVNDVKLFSEEYRRYMEKQLRANIGYHGTPIRLLWRNKNRPERKESSKRVNETVLVGSPK